jgi:hypothetical protein
MRYSWSSNERDRECSGSGFSETANITGSSELTTDIGKITGAGSRRSSDSLRTITHGGLLRLEEDQSGCWLPSSPLPRSAPYLRKNEACCRCGRDGDHGDAGLEVDGDVQAVRNSGYRRQTRRFQEDGGVRAAAATKRRTATKQLHSLQKPPELGQICYFGSGYKPETS